MREFNISSVFICRLSCVEEKAMKVLIITKNNYLDFLELKLNFYIKAGEKDYFLRQLKNLCKIVPEFTYKPILIRRGGSLCYDSKFYWKDNVGRCALRFQNTYFGFDDKKISGYKQIHINYESFGIKQISSQKVKRFCGVPVDYLSKAEQEKIRKEEERIRKQRVKSSLKERKDLIKEIKLLEGG